MVKVVGMSGRSLLIWLNCKLVHLQWTVFGVNRDHALLKHMVMHYKVRNLVCKARIRSLKAKLKKAVKKQKRQKELDHLRILAEASLAEHGT